MICNWVVPCRANSILESDVKVAGLVTSTMIALVVIGCVISELISTVALDIIETISEGIADTGSPTIRIFLFFIHCA